jgi:hypothetical protein
MGRPLICWTAALWLGGCAHSAVPPPKALDGDDASAAHGLVIEAAACWLGPVWGDAIGEPRKDRVAFARRQCEELVGRVWGVGNAAGAGRSEQLRALDPATIAELARAVDAAARSDSEHSRRTQLVALVRALADAERELLWARRAAERIKVDLADAHGGQSASDRLTADERTAVEPLGAAKALYDLHNLRASAYTGDAHALGVMLALERLQIAQGLPRRLRIVAVAPAFRVVFAVAPPLSDETNRPVPAGAWLDYLKAAAAAAGHRVPPTAELPKEQNLLAWAGVLAGFAEDLRADQPRVSRSLYALIEGTAKRLDAEAALDRDAFLAAQQWDASWRGDLDKLVANCPSIVPGASTRLFKLDDGVAVAVSAGDAGAIAAIQERARKQQEGRDGAYCPMVPRDSVLTTKYEPDGVRLTIKPKSIGDLAKLQETTENRVDALRLRATAQP